MLDIMRRKKRLRAVLWLVILSLALGMLLFFIPGQNTGVSGFDTYAASVDGDTIPLKEFVNTYRRMVENFGAQARSRLDPEIMKKLGLDRQAIDALINMRVIRYAARRLGLDVAPEEIRKAVENHPNLQYGGAFIGVERYKSLLNENNISVGDFEDGIRFMLLEKKTRSVISDSMEISEQELRDEFLRANQQSQAAFVQFKRDDFTKQIKPAEADLRAYFEGNKAKYPIKEQRRAQYLVLSISALAPTITVSEKELRDRWARESHEESVDASHILFKVEDPAKDSEVKAKAAEVLKQARAGADFAELAKKNSQDEVSARQGGNLGAFARGRMVKEFEDVAFALKPGEISDLVKSQFGYHIIKVLRHEIPDFETGKKALERQIQLDKASDILKKKGAEAQELAKKEKDLQKVAEALKLPAEIKETGFLSKDSDPYTNQISPALLGEIFRLKEIGQAGNTVDHPAGHALPKLLEIKLPRPPDFTEARARVEKDYVEIKAAERMQTEAKQLAEAATRLGGLDKAAKELGLKVKETGSFKRSDSPDPEIGTAPSFNNAAFELAPGAVSPPITLEGRNRVVVLTVKSRSGFDEAEYLKQKGQIRDRVQSMWKDVYFEEYIRRIMQTLEKAGKIRINQRAIDEATGLRS